MSHVNPQVHRLPRTSCYQKNESRALQKAKAHGPHALPAPELPLTALKAFAQRCRITTLSRGAHACSSAIQCERTVAGHKTSARRITLLSWSAPRKAATCSLFGGRSHNQQCCYHDPSTNNTTPKYSTHSTEDTTMTQ